MSWLVKCWPDLKCGITLSVYTSHCIVTRPPDHDPPTSRIYFQSTPPENLHKSCRKPMITRALVNPGNEELVGPELPYFPMGGPTPKDLLTTNWGGAISGSGMFYAIQSVDGMVSLHGGKDLRKACKNLPVYESVDLIGGGGNAIGGVGSVRCPVGSAVITDAFGHAVTRYYSIIVHTVPPLWPGFGGSKLSEDEAIFLLRSCYYESFKAGFSNGAAIVTTPLLGSGARRAPEGAAIDCAVKGILDAMGDSYRAINNKKVKRSVDELKTPQPWPPIAAEIVVLEPRTAMSVVRAIDFELESLAVG